MAQHVYPKMAARNLCGSAALFVTNAHDPVPLRPWKTTHSTNMAAKNMHTCAAIFVAKHPRITFHEPLFTIQDPETATKSF